MSEAATATVLAKRRQPRRMPTCSQIAVYWAERGEPFRVYLDSPECFGCRRAEDDWAQLQRCHLVARSLDGLDGPQNLVLLCDWCHHHQPDGDLSGRAAVFFVLMGGWVGMAIRLSKYSDLSLDEFDDLAFRLPPPSSLVASVVRRAGFGAALDAWPTTLR
jgi:hypothetical protein